MNNPEADDCFNLGLSQFKEGRFEESLVSFQRAVELKPDDPEFLDLLGNAYNEMGQLDEALKALDQAISVDATYALAHYDRGVILAQVKGRGAAAIKSFKRAIALDADLYWAYYSIGCVYALGGKTQLALRFLNKAFQKGFEELIHLENDTDWDSLRDNPRFQEIISKNNQKTAGLSQTELFEKTGPEIRLLNEDRADGSSLRLSAYLDAAGRLHIDGQDFGPVTKPVSGDGEYEYSYLVQAKDIQTAVKVLGGGEGEDILDVLSRGWQGQKSHGIFDSLEAGQVPVELFTWSG